MNISLLTNNRKETTFFALCAFNFGLIAIRVIATESLFYGFLVWNLILAGVPLIISTWLLENPKACKSKILFLLSAIWLLFLPNAPYIITDFLHFKTSRGMPEWFDLLLLMSFSWSGIAFGFLSMADMHKIWETRFNAKTGWMFIAACCLLSGFGIYLGRFLRYNSWDIISNPLELITDIPLLLCQLRTIGFSLGYGSFVLLAYSFFKFNSAK